MPGRRVYAVSLKHNRSVVIKSRSATLEKRGHDYYPELGGENGICLGDIRGDSHGKVTHVGRLRLAEIERIVQLLIYDKLSSISGQPSHFLTKTGTVVGNITVIRLLDKSYTQY